MTVVLNSYLSFRDNAREAAEYYASVFDGEVELDVMGSYDSPEMPVADEDKDKIMHAQVKGPHVTIMMADTPTGMEFTEGQRVTLTLNGDDEATLKSYWDKLAADGTVTMPLGPSPWGDQFGMLTDKFGFAWMVDIS